jgi:hypothetical protein
MKPQQKLRQGLTPAPIGSQPASATHTFTCPACGEMIDRNNLGQMLVHGRPAHRVTARVDREHERAMERHIAGQA